MTESIQTLTRLLDEAHSGRDGAIDEVMDLVYTDLRRLANKHMRQKFGHGLAGVTLEPAALVNETYMKLIRQRNRYDSSGHFFAIATRVMLRVLIDYQRTRAAMKRGGDLIKVSLADLDENVHGEILADAVDFSRALDRLENLAKKTAEVVKLRLLWGMTVPEIAETLDISKKKAEAEWRFGRKWMAKELRA